MQTLLATLADLDFAHECELQRVVTGSGDAAVKEQVGANLEAMHRERRDPYVQQLATLQASIRAEMPDVSRDPSDPNAA